MTESPHIPHQLTSNIKLLHKAAVIIDGKVLLLKRAPDSKSRPDKWDLPGGNSEWPTDIQQLAQDLHRRDVAREIVEETGLVVEPGSFDFSKLTYFTTFFQPDKQIYTIICGWMAELSAIQFGELPEVKISSEHTEFAWVSRDELANYDFGVEFILEIIEAAFAKAV